MARDILIDPKSVYSILQFVTNSSPNFLNCSSPGETVLVYANYLRSHFFVSPPEATCLSSVGPPTLKNIIPPSALRLPPLNFLPLQSTFSLHRYWPGQSRLSHAEAPASLWPGCFSPRFLSFLVIVLFAFHLEVFIY